jgi:hypothetical protein
MKTTSRVYQNFNLFITVYLICFFISISYMLIQLNYFQISTLNNFVWNWDDFPGVPNVPKVSAFGGHYFGDFLHLITTANNPPGQTPFWPYLPFTNLFSIPFLQINYLVGYFIFSTVFIFMGFINTIQLFKFLNYKDLVIFTMFFIFGNVGTLYLLDRGNIQLAVSGFIGLSIFFLMRDRFHLFAFFIGVAGAIKVWPLFFLIYLVKHHKLKSFVLGIATFVILNFCALTFLQIPILEMIPFISQQIIEIRQFNSAEGALWHRGGKNTSLLVTLYIFNQIDMISNIATFFIEHYLYIQALALFIFVVMYLRLKQKNLILELLMISCFLLIIPAAQYGYSTSIISILVPLLLVDQIFFNNNNNFVRNIREKFIFLIAKRSIIVLLAIVLVSWTIRIPDRSGDTRYLMDLNSVFSPLGILLIMSLGFWILMSKVSLNQNSEVENEDMNEKQP